MTYKTYDMQEYILFIPRNGIGGTHYSGFICLIL